jgi:hypothetical protein
MADDVTYFSKDEIICPVCQSHFYREELRMGGGRLSAGELTDELRRTYVPTAKYGKVVPLLYPITVCPNCLYSADDFDFLSLPPKAFENITSYRGVRSQYLIKIFGRVPDFEQKRDLVSGIASYILATSCYSFFDQRKFAPTIKRGVYCLRICWLFNDLFQETKEQKFLDLAQIFHKKSADFYDAALTNQTRGLEPLEGSKSLGPDTDKNFGYDGVVYLNGVLKFKNANFIEDPIQKLKVYEDVKIILSKVFGFGKKAKEKPGPLLELSRGIYDKINEELEILQTSLGDAAVPEEQEGEGK